MSKNIVLVSDATFEKEVLNSDLPVLVDFWAPWCGPCMALAPTLEKVADEKQGIVKICKVNVDDNPESAANYGVRGIPTLILFNKGETVSQITGSVPKQQIEELIEKV